MIKLYLILILSMLFTYEFAFSAGFKYGGIKFDIASSTTAGTTTTLTASSSQIQAFDGSSNQTVKLPDATTLSNGYWYTINNEGTGTITAKDNGNGILASVAASGSAIFAVKSNGSAGGVWDVQNRGTTGASIVGAVNSGSTANGADISGSTITLHYADGTNPGLLSATTQTVGGQKTLTNPIVGTQASSDNSTLAASTAYVQTALAQLNPAAAVVAASTANIVGTYTNAVGGVCIGDTFQVTSTAAFVVDGITLTTGQRVLFKDQTSSFQSGVWTLTTAANVGVLGALLTRALDFDSSADINSGQIIPVSGGTVNSGSSWYQTANNTTCNSSNQTWTQFQKASSAYLLAASNLSDVASAPISRLNLGVASIASQSTASSTTTFTSASSETQIFTGTQDQTITLPAANTLLNGNYYTIVNEGTGYLTVRDNGAATISTVAASETVTVSLKANGTSAGLWDVQAPVASSSVAIAASDINWSLVRRNGGVFTQALTANTVFTFSHPTAGQAITCIITNTASNRTVTWPSGVKWVANTAPTQTVGVHTDIITFIYDGIQVWGNSVQNF